MGNAIIILVILVIAAFGAHWGMKHYCICKFCCKYNGFFI